MASRRGAGNKLGETLPQRSGVVSVTCDTTPMASYIEERTVVYYKVLVAGEVGVGKSMLISTLTNTLPGGATLAETQRTPGAPVFDEGHTTVLTFAPSAARRHRPLTVLCTLVDAPPAAGSDDGLSHDLSRVKDYVEGCIERYWTATDRTHAATAAGAAAMTAAEASGVAGVSLRAGEFDSRVDVVLYLLPPRARLAQWDRDALLALSAVAVVVPVVTRADTVTRAEVTALRESLGQQLRRAGLSLMDPVLLSAAAAAAAGGGGGSGGGDPDLPLVVAAGAQLDAGQPVRRYGWGEFRANAREYSDLELLKGLLFSEQAILSLKHQTENLFTMYKRRTPAVPSHRGGDGGVGWRAVSRGGWLTASSQGSSLTALGFVAAAFSLLLLSVFMLLRTLAPGGGGGGAGGWVLGVGESVAGGVRLDVNAEDEQDGMEGFTEELRDSPHQIRMLDRINAQTGGMAEVVLGGNDGFVMFMLAPELVSPTGEPVDNNNDHAAGDDPDNSACTPVVTSLPVHALLYQTVDGRWPDARQQIGTVGSPVLHAQHYLAYLPPSNRRSLQVCGPGGCWDQFALTFPCRMAHGEDDAHTLTVRVLQPPPLSIAVPIFAPDSVPQQLEAGELDLPLEWLGIARAAQRALKEAGLTQGEMHVFLSGPGKLKLSPNMPKVNKHLVEQVRELPHSVYAVGTLEGMALMLKSLVYRHPGVSHATDQVVATLTLWAPRRDSVVAAQTRARIHVDSGCSPAAALVDGDGLTTGRPLTVAEVSVACELKSGDDNVTVLLQSPEFHQTLLASHVGEGLYKAQYLRPSWPYTLSIFINQLPSDNSPYRINSDPHAKGRAKGAAHGGLEGGGTRFESALPQADVMVQGRGAATSGKEIYGSKDAFSGLMDSMASADMSAVLRMKSPKAGRLRGESGQGALLAALARASGASSSINAVPVNSKGSVAGGSTRGGAGALPLPKFDANGRVVGTNTLGTSKAFLAKGSSRSKVANINAGDITTTADVLESLNPFAAVSRPKLGGVAGDDGQAELAEAIPQSSGVWLTGANAATLGMAALGADAEEEE